MAPSNLDPYRPFDEVVKEDFSVGSSLDPYRPFDESPESSSQLATSDNKLDPYRPFDDEVIDVDTKSVPDKGLTTGQQVSSLGIDVGGSIGSQVLGAASLAIPGVGPLAYGAIAFGGGLSSNILAQMTAEGRSFDEISWGRALSAGFINLIPGSSAVKLARPIATEAARGALIGAADITFQKAIDEKRMPTMQEYLFAGSLGGAFGSAGGAINKKVNEAKGLVYGMNYTDIDKLLLTKEGAPLRDALKEEGIDWSDNLLKKKTEQLHEKISLQKKKNADMSITEGWTETGGVFDSLNPFLVTKDSIRTEAFRFDQRVRTLRNFQEKLPKDVSDALEGIKNEKSGKVQREFGEDISSYLNGNEMTERLAEQSWSPSLMKFRKMENEFYEDMLTVLSSEDRYDIMFADLGAAERDHFRNKIERARLDKGYRARQYKALIPGAKEQGTAKKYDLMDEDALNRERVDTGEKYYDAMFNEIKEWQVKNNPALVSKAAKAEMRKELTGSDGKLSDEAKTELNKFITEEQLVGPDGKSGLIKTHINDLIKRNQSASEKTILKNTLPGNVELILKNHIPGELESRWLGEVTDVGFRMKQGNLQLGQQLAKFKVDKAIAQNLSDRNLISLKPQGELQDQIGSLGSFKQKFYTSKPMADALDQVFSNTNVFQFNQKQLDNVLNTWKRLESSSKGVKVLLNTPSYAVNFLGANASMLGMGMLPTGANLKSFYKTGLSKGLRQSRFLDKVIDNVTKPDAAKKLRILDELEELQGLGVLDADTASLFADDITQGLKAGKSQITKALDGATQFIGKIYSLSDVAARINVYEHNTRHLGKIFPKMAVENSQAFKRMAAEVTNDTYQNYARVSKIVRELSKLGIMPQFVTFTAELTRNLTHQYRIATEMAAGKFGRRYGVSDIDMASADISAMRAEGIKRLGFLTGVIAGSTVLTDQINQAQGIDEEKDNYYRSIFPQYLRNKSLVYIADKENPNNISVANMSYLVPQAVAGSALQALFAGTHSERDMVQFLLDEFVGEGTFFTKEIYRSIDNRDKYGEKITRATEFNERMYDMFSYIFKESFEPGTARELQKLQQAKSGKGLYNEGEVWMRQFGLRIQKLEVDKYVRFKLQDLADAQSEYKGDYTKAKKYEFVEGRIDESELEARYQLNNERSRSVYNEIAKTYRDTLSQSGLSKNEVDEIFTGSRSNLSSKNKIAILSGLEYTDMPREIIMTQQESYDSMFGLNTDINQYSDYQIKSKIRSFKRSDPNRYRTFNRIYTDAKKVEGQKSLTTVQKLLKKLSVYDRALTIKQLGLDNKEDLNKLRKIGIYTDQVKQTMRALGQ
jgi:hypothetical protein